MPSKTTKYQAPALEKGLDILEFMSQMGIPLTHAELAAGLNRSAHEIYRMMLCLEKKGYIAKVGFSGKYKLTLKLYQLSHRHSPVDELKYASENPMQELTSTIRQSCHLSMLYEGQLFVVAQARSPLPIALSVEEGSQFPLTLTTSGKLLLACLEESDRQRILAADKSYQGFTSAQQKAFDKQLKNIQAEQCFVSQSALSSGITDIAVPVRNAETGTVYVLAVIVLTSQIEGVNSLDFILQEARKCAGQILNNLGIASK